MVKLILSITISACALSFSKKAGQTANAEHFNLLSVQYPAGDSTQHVDSTYNFKLVVPDWWNIRETPSNFFGGTFPAIDGIENALLLKCFDKAKFKSISDFENWVIKDYSMGQSPKWSSQHTILLKKALADFKELGNSYKVQLMKGGTMYDCCYILTETSTAYIWIDFTATSTTYPKNFEKFKEIINLFKRF